MTKPNYFINPSGLTLKCEKASEERRAKSEERRARERERLTFFSLPFRSLNQISTEKTQTNSTPLMEDENSAPTTSTMQCRSLHGLHKPPTPSGERRFLIFLAFSLLWSFADGAFDYADALSKSLLYFESQRSGRLPYNQRVNWRDHSGLTDGLEQGVSSSKFAMDALFSLSVSLAFW